MKSSPKFFFFRLITKLFIISFYFILQFTIKFIINKFLPRILIAAEHFIRFLFFVFLYSIKKANGMLAKHSENLKITLKLKKEETKRDWYGNKI